MHHHHYDDHNDHPPDPLPPPDNMSNQPPQLEASICSHAGGCECNQNIDGEDDDSSESDGTLLHSWHVEDGHPPNNASDNSEDIYGDEGPRHDQIEAPNYEHHFIGVGNHGLLSLVEIFEALARHDVCTCHHNFPIGVLPNEYMMNVNSAPHTPSSMCVEPRSLEGSMLLTPPAEAPMICSAFVGDSYFPAVPNYMLNPLPLSPVYHPPYRMELVLTDENSNDDHSV